MPRTTINLDASVAGQLKNWQRRNKKSLSDLVNQLLARALANSEVDSPQQPLRWISRPMCSRIDLEDKEALMKVLDQA